MTENNEADKYGASTGVVLERIVSHGLPKVIKTDNGQFYIIKLADGTAFWQRIFEIEATDNPLNCYEKIIICLCEHILVG